MTPILRSAQVGRIRFLLLLVLAAPSSAWAVSDAVQQFVKWETQSNPAHRDSPDAFEVKHFEIPLRLVSADFAQSLAPEIRDSLIFEKNGEKYVRWIINITDKLWYKDVVDFMNKHHLPVERKTYFKAYATASRSMIIEDPVTGAVFSAKASTQHAGGKWADKKQTHEDAKWIRMADDYIRDVKNRVQLNHLKILEEPAIMGIPEIDQAVAIRTLGDLPQNGHYYLPGFSALHTRTGAEIAKLNGSNDPAAFWNEHYNKPLGRASAEFLAHFGMSLDSPHSQNFLVELDKNMKPTGKIVIRDVADTYVQKEFFENSGHADFVKNWDQNNVIAKKALVKIGIINGSYAPDWLEHKVLFVPTQKYLKQWASDFFTEFENEFSKITKIPKAELEKTTMKKSDVIFQKSYDIQGGAWTHFVSGNPSCAKRFSGL